MAVLVTVLAGRPGFGRESFELSDQCELPGATPLPPLTAARSVIFAYNELDGRNTALRRSHSFLWEEVELAAVRH